MFQFRHNFAILTLFNPLFKIQFSTRNSKTFFRKKCWKIKKKIAGSVLTRFFVRFDFRSRNEKPTPRKWLFGKSGLGRILTKDFLPLALWDSRDLYYKALYGCIDLGQFFIFSILPQPPLHPQFEETDAPSDFHNRTKLLYPTLTT